MDIPPIPKRQPTRWDSKPYTIQHLHGQVRQVRSRNTHTRTHTRTRTERKSCIWKTSYRKPKTPEKRGPRKSRRSKEGNAKAAFHSNHDPGYRRLRYIRYADDFLLGVIGPMTEAEEIKERIATFLGTELKLTLSAEKTLITHANTGRARFLGYEIGIMESQTKFDHRRVRVVNGRVGMYIPEDVIPKKRKRYLRDGKPIHRSELLNDSEYDIIHHYQGEYRGLVNYYGLAQNLANLRYLRWTMETSLLKTLASKNRSSVAKETKRLEATTKTPEGPRKSLKLTVPREGKTHLTAIFGGLSLKRRRNPVMKDQVLTPSYSYAIRNNRTIT